LLLFAHAAPRIRLSTLGLLQYIAPTAQLMLGVWVYQESFSMARLGSFGLIWCGLALYTLDNLSAHRRSAARGPAEVKVEPGSEVRPGRE
jgi:chloramphenicol-sensitive protein RarD